MKDFGSETLDARASDNADLICIISALLYNGNVSPEKNEIY